MTNKVSSVIDPCTYADLKVTTTTHTDLIWALDLESKTLTGTATHTIAVSHAAADEGKVEQVTFDNKGCVVQKVEIGAAPSTLQATEVTEGKTCEAYGTALHVAVPTALSKESVLTVKFHYEVAPDCSALDWLSKDQTKDKQLPFMYSQCQPINARSLFPCQDSPSVRMTYTATVSHAEDVTVLMSALPVPEESVKGKTVFNQPQKITPYLVAICAGCIAARDCSDRCRVYAEPSLVDACATEFAEVETLLKTAEDIAGPYRWTRYDLVVLPPSFPYGGMENPNLTFVTPSIVCGDKSGVDVVAHEICHSWSGNLVGTASWADFFLNEGFTVLLQRKISKKLYGRPFSEFEGMSGRKALEDTIRGRGAENPYTALRPNLDGGVDPEEIFSSVPYEKGYALLRAMESVVGEDDEFDRWLTSYFNTFAGVSITGYQMKEHFLKHYAAKADAINAAIDWEAWFYQPGLPIVTHAFDTSARQECIDFAQKVVALNAAATPGDLPVPPASWRGGHKTAFLEDLKSAFLEGADPIKKSTLESLDKTFNYSSEVNNEVLCGWFQICLLHSKQQVDGKDTIGTFDSYLPPMNAFLQSIGRMKFVRPLYRAWYAVAPPAAQEAFKANKGLYHNIANKMLLRDLGLVASNAGVGI